jgi:hypothetical protein
MSEEVQQQQADVIDNWSIWGSTEASVSLLKYQEDEENYVYQGMINYHLSEEPARMISTPVDVWDDCPYCLIRHIIDRLSDLYDTVDTVIVMDGETGDLLDEEYSIDEAYAYEREETEEEVA